MSLFIGCGIFVPAGLIPTHLLEGGGNFGVELDDFLPQPILKVVLVDYLACNVELVPRAQHRLVEGGPIGGAHPKRVDVGVPSGLGVSELGGMLFEITEISPVLEEVGSGAVLVGGSASIGLFEFA